MALFAACVQSSGVVSYSGLPYASAYNSGVYGAPSYVSAPITQYSSYPAIASPVAYASSPVAYASSPLAYAASPVSYAASPVAYAAAPVSYSSYSAPSVYTAASPLAYAAKAYAVPSVYQAPAVIAKLGATYTAATRGAVHTAPLEGHALSQTSLNVAPAPGTW